MVGTRAIVKAGPFEIWPSKSPVFKCFQISNGRISDPHFIHSFFQQIKLRPVHSDSSAIEKDASKESVNRSADDLINQSANDVFNQSGDDQSIDDVIKPNRPTLDRDTYRRTYSKKEEWVIADEDLATNSGGTVNPRHCVCFLFLKHIRNRGLLIRHYGKFLFFLTRRAWIMDLWAHTCNGIGVWTGPLACLCLFSVSCLD